ncbi:hypothetical protein AtEden1_Chr5g0144521 [Arabidopsis thaliana]
MGIASSVSMAYSDEDPSANQGQFSRDEDESRTLIEDLNETGEGKGEEEESGECRLCRFIKGGECKESFIALEQCVDEAEESGEESDFTKCKEVRAKFKTCMYENPVYYEPILAGEARAIAKMLMELQAEKEAILAVEAAAIAKALSKLPTEEAELGKAESKE